ncbi:MAG: hypothetical protein KatS3mg129_2155 [Leptospiraceae bacterium]|nr:MAG: hypothetical protein KatS3mg129_2155 [Leptospiraceae bacterium]
MKVHILILIGVLLLYNIPISSQVYQSYTKYSKYLNKNIIKDIIPFRKIIEKEKIHLKPLWLKLLHYEKTIWGFESQIDSSKFFLSYDDPDKKFPAGKWDPKIELFATLESYFVEIKYFDNIELHPVCAFPARLKFIKEIFRKSGIEIHFPEVPCRNYKLFLNEFDPHTLSYVFASYYLGAPASIFGHTFIKINSRRNRDDLLDYSINYAANPGDIDIFRYIVYGLFGGYQGYYSVLPYHIKVNEYNDIEERDLWEYELDLNEEQLDWILKHLWELANFSSMDYYFATENCSYQLLTLLQVSLPDDINFIEELNGFVIPTETVKILKSLGIIKKRKYRPSIKSQILQRLQYMNHKEKNYYHILLENRLVPFIPDKSENNDVNYLFVYDTLLLHYKYLKIKKKITEEENQFYKELLLRRANYSSDKQTYHFKPMSTPVDEAHSSSMLSIGSGYYYYNKQKYNIVDIKYRYLYHDFLNDSVGFPQYTELENFYFWFRYDSSKNSLYLKNFKLFNIYSLNAYRKYYFIPSYHTEVGHKNIYKEDYEFNIRNYFYTRNFITDNINLFLLYNKNSIYYNKILDLEPLTYGMVTIGSSLSNNFYNISLLIGAEIDQNKFSYKGEFIYILHLFSFNMLLKTSCNWFDKENFCVNNFILSYLLNKNFEFRLINEWEENIYHLKLNFTYLF